VTEPTIVLPDAMGSITDTKSAREVAHFSKGFREEWVFRATLRNSLRACVAARRSSCLRVPNILHADAEELRIDYEFLDGWPLHSSIRHRTFRELPTAELRRTFWTIDVL
jgi:hypothetical protein